jgi:hypothetical protein
LAEPEPDARRKPEFVIVDHELSLSQIRNLEFATRAELLCPAMHRLLCLIGNDRPPMVGRPVTQHPLYR